MSNPYTAQRVSHSQISTGGHCLRQLYYYRLGEERGPKGITATQGLAVHAGIEDFLVYHDVERAVLTALTDLEFRVEELGDGGTQWDDPPRLTKGYWYKREGYWKTMPQPYKGEEGAMPDLETAKAITEFMVRAWAMRFPDIRVTPRTTCPECGGVNEENERRCPFCETSLVGIERKVRFPLAPHGIDGWEMTCVFDIEPDAPPPGVVPPAGWAEMVDLKVSREAWTKPLEEDEDPQRPLTHLDLTDKRFDKLEQARLYQQAKLALEGRLPSSFFFHNLPGTGVQVEVTQPDGEGPDKPFKVRPVGYDPAAIQVISVDYDAEAVETLMRYRVEPTIRAIEQNIYPPNTSGWWCTAKFCDYWHVCPLGELARKGRAATKRVARGAA